MPIPLLDPHGLLPLGVHDCTVDEIGERFGGSNDGPRRDLFNGFLRWRGLLLRRNLPVEIFVDGSFTTSKDYPGDVDVALRLPAPTRELARALREADDLLNPAKTKPTYSVDVHVFSDGVDEPASGNLVRFYSMMRPEDARRHGVPGNHVRGILRVRL